MLAAVAVSGCARGSHPISPPPVETASTVCPEQTDLSNVGQQRLLPRDFPVAWVLRCTVQVLPDPGGAKWQTLITERADTPATTLLAELRKASDPPTNAACDLRAVFVPYFALVTSAGTAVRVDLPRDSCGKPRAAALDALSALPFRATASKMLKQLTSSLAAKSGCPQSWKDEFDLGRTAKAGRTGWPAAATIQVCAYRVATPAGPIPVGDLTAARTLTGSAARTLVTALNHAPAATTCTVWNSRFAVLRSDSGQPAVVELDGCHRLLRPDDSLGQLTPAITATLG